MPEQIQSPKSQTGTNNTPVKVIKEHTHITEVRMISKNSISGTFKTMKTEKLK